MEALNVSQIERGVPENDKTEEKMNAKVKNISWKNLTDFYLLSSMNNYRVTGRKL